MRWASRYDTGCSVTLISNKQDAVHGAKIKNKNNTLCRILSLKRVGSMNFPCMENTYMYILDVRPNPLLLCPLLRFVLAIF